MFVVRISDCFELMGVGARLALVFAELLAARLSSEDGTYKTSKPDHVLQIQVKLLQTFQRARERESQRVSQCV